MNHASARPFVWLSLIAVLALELGAQQPVFRSGIKLVETTVVVHDREGKPVADLQASDFKILEDGKEQKVEFFAVQGETGDRSVQSFPLPRNVFSNRPEQSTGGGVTVILLDRLNSKAEDLKVAKDQVIKLLAEAGPDDRIALYVLESWEVTVLHDFTSDTQRLTAVLNKHLRNTSVAVAALEDKAPVIAASGIPELDADTTAWLDRGNIILSELLLAQRGRVTSDDRPTRISRLASSASVHDGADGDGEPGRDALTRRQDRRSRLLEYQCARRIGASRHGRCARVVCAWLLCATVNT